MAQKILVNDKVMVIAGKDKNKVGKVIKILKDKHKVIVEGVNLIKKHVKPNPYRNESGGIVEKEAPIDISNVALMCESCAKPTRVGFKFTEEGKKVRYCKKCNEVISKVR